MASWTPGQYRAVVLLLVVLVGSGFFVMMRRGHAAEDGLVITGQAGQTPAPAPNKTLSNPPPNSPPVPSGRSAAPSTGSEKGPATVVAEPPKDVVVHVAGAVRKPGVYHLAVGARADDAVKEAGGAKETANLDAINLAAKLEDGQQLYIPTRKEQPEGGAPVSTSASPSAPAAKTPHASSSSAVHASSHASSHGDKLTTPGQGTVNINTAGEEELQRLPGVGPAMAARILEFRKQNGAFSSPEQLMDVSGIGEKKFAKMQPFVRVR